MPAALQRLLAVRDDQRLQLAQAQAAERRRVEADDGLAGRGAAGQPAHDRHERDRLACSDGRAQGV
ncbi:MAG: hypothetical protein BWY52_02562 [Chloroflexi bacterium ADurb.Bin325]|nr:MAG: hypothetical protein BWY52_02562 [Chloroflexi bacterium ADurb.Bin325]